MRLLTWCQGCLYPAFFLLIESDRTAFLEAVTENRFPADERDELGSVETYGQNALLPSWTFICISYNYKLILLNAPLPSGVCSHFLRAVKHDDLLFLR